MSSKYVTVKSKGLNTLAKRYGDKFKEVIKSKSLLTDLGNEIVKDVRFQARRGNTTNETGNQGKMDPLKQSWRDKRKEFAKRGQQTHQAYSANRSNLTFSGQLLDALSITKIENASVTVGFTGTHRPYEVPYKETFRRNGVTVNANRAGTTKLGKPLSNAELASYVQNKRPFMNLRKEFVERLKTLVIRFIRRNLK